MRPGMTLIEVLVSIALILVLLGVLFTFISDLLATRERIRTVVDRQATIAMLFDRLEQDLALAIVGDAVLGPGVSGDSTSIRILSRGVLPGDPDPAVALVDLHRTEYRFDRATETVTASRRAARGANGSSSAAGAAPGTPGTPRGQFTAVPIGAEIADLRLRYHDGREWLASFDSLSRAGLPMAVEIALWLPEEAAPDDGSGTSSEEQHDGSAAEEAEPLDELFDDRLFGAGENVEGLRATASEGRFPDRAPDRVRVIALPDARPLDDRTTDRPDADSEGDSDRDPERDSESDSDRDAAPQADATTPARAALRVRARRGARVSGRRGGHRSGRRGFPLHSARRRGFILIAVIVAAAVGAIVVLGMMSLVRAESALAASRQERAQAQALAWSGVQAVAVTLDRQRDRILAGELPSVPNQLILDDGGSRIAVARLIPFGDSGGAASDAASIRAEAGCLDLNRLDAAALAATGLVTPEEAAAIVALRSRLGGRFQSELDLLELARSARAASEERRDASGAAIAARNGASAPGIAIERLLGARELEEWNETVAGAMASAAGIAGEGLRERAGSAGVARGGRGLLEIATVHAVEPMLQRSGAARHRLGEGWSDELAVAIDRQFGTDAAIAAKALVESGTLQNDGSILAALRGREVPEAEWPALVDAFTTDRDPLHGGRLDLNTASYEALLSLPEATPAFAAEIVRQRDGLSVDDRATPLWPLLRGIVDAPTMEKLAGRVTTRSFLWRVRLAAGEVDSDDPDGPLLGATIWEAVIDLTTPRWRIAHLRDITLLPAALHLAGSAFDAERRERDSADAAEIAGGAATTSYDERGITRSEAPSAVAIDRTEMERVEMERTEMDAVQMERPTGPRAGRGEGRERRGPARRRGPRDAAPDPASEASPTSPPPAPAGPAPVGRWRT